MAFDLKKYFPKFSKEKATRPDTIERTPSKSMSAFSSFMKFWPNPDKVQQYQSNGEGLNLYIEMPKQDPDLAGIIRQRSLGVAAKTWEVQPFDDTPESKEIAAFVNENLNRLPEFTDIRQKMAETFWMGFSVFEVIWEINEAGSVTIADLRDRHQNRFRFSVEGTLQYKVSATSNDWKDAEDKKFITIKHNVRGENPYGSPLAQSCYLSFWIKLDAGLKNWAIATEKFAMPTPHVKYGNQLKDEEKAALKEAADGWMADNSIVTSNNIEIQLLEAVRQGAPYESLLRYIIEAYGRAILGQSKTTSASKFGTRGDTTVGQDLQDDIIQADAEKVSAAINQAIKWLVDFNFPNAAGYPSFWINYEPQKDRKAIIEVLSAAANSGVPVPVSHVLEELGIPLRLDDEPILTSTAPVVPDQNADDPNAEKKPKQDQLSLSGNAADIIEVAKFFTDASQAKDKLMLQLNSGKGKESTSEADGEVVALSDQPVNKSLESNVRLAAEDPSRFLPNLPPIADPSDGQPVAVQPAQSLKRYNIGSIATLQNASRRELRKVYNGFVRAILSEFGNLPGGSTAAQQHENMMQVIDDFIVSDLKPNLQAPLSAANRNAIRAAARQMASQLGSAFNAGEYESMVTAYLRVHAFEMTAFVPRATILEGIAVDTRARFAAKVSEAIQSGGDLDEIVTWLKGELPQLADWKATQIAITESRTAANWAVLESGIRSGLDLEAYFIVDPESCVVCQTWASMNPYNMRVAQGKGLPHPNCGDYWMLTPKEGSA